MELSEFVTSTLEQICNGVSNAQGKCKEMGAYINPMFETMTHGVKDYPTTKVDFNIGLTELSSEGNKNGIGVFLGKLSFGHESDKGNAAQSVTSIGFSINTILPCVDRQGKNVVNIAAKDQASK